MSMLETQADELRGYALSVRNVALRTTSLYHEARRDLLDSALRMEQAADTITSLSNKLQGVMGTRYSELFGTPERAARTLAKACGECDDNLPCDECPLAPIIGRNVYEPELLEWLRGDV